MAAIFPPIFMPAIRDYVYILNNISDTTVGNINLLQVLTQSLIYVLSSIKFIIIYLASFQWLRDLSYLPVIVPQLKVEILKEHLFLQTPQANFFTFLEIPSYTSNKFFLGFVNSLVLCLPLSLSRIMALRRLVIEGFESGSAANFGTITGEFLLILCIIGGGRFFIIPWFNFHLVSYIIGMVLILTSVYEIIDSPRIPVIKNFTPEYNKIFLLHFLLAWTEQSCIYQYFGNLTFGPEPSIIETFPSSEHFQQILTHGNYLLGIGVGSVVFSNLLISIYSQLLTLIVNFFVFYSTTLRILNQTFIVLIITFSFTSVPFYSLNYFIGSNFGFVPYEKSLKNTRFSPAKLYDYMPPATILGQIQDPRETNIRRNRLYLDLKPGLDIDPSRFNRGRYLMFDVNESFEYQNFQADYRFWIHRKQSLARHPKTSYAVVKIKQWLNKSKIFKTGVSSVNTQMKNFIFSKKIKKNEPTKIKKNKITKVKTNNTVVQRLGHWRNAYEPSDWKILIFDFINQQSDLVREQQNENLYKQPKKTDNQQLQSYTKIFTPVGKSIHSVYKCFYNYVMYGEFTSQHVRQIRTPFVYFGKYYTIYRRYKDYRQTIFKKNMRLNFYRNSLIRALRSREMKFRRKYYGNPIYKLLIKADIDFFLSHQPKSFFLSPKQERKLMENRFILSQYYDTLRYYNKLSNQKYFNQNYFGSKSYTDRVYNQQFSGTLKLIRRLFLVTEQVAHLNLPLMVEQNFKMNYTQQKFSNQNDQLGDYKYMIPLKLPNGKLKKQPVPLKRLYDFVNKKTFYKKYKSKNKHKSISPPAFRSHKILPKNKNTKNNWFVLKFDMPLYKKIKTKTQNNTIFLHEELKNPRKSTISNNQTFKNTVSKPFMELSNPIPFYVGWDEQLRKLVITNRLSPKKLAGQFYHFPTTQYINKKFKDTITFTTWPIGKFQRQKTRNDDMAYNVLGYSLEANTKARRRYDIKYDKFPRFQLFNYKYKKQQYNNDETQKNINDTQQQYILARKTVDGPLQSIPSNIILNLIPPDMSSFATDKRPSYQMPNIIPYTRGGYNWPGQLDFDFFYKRVKNFLLNSKYANHVKL